MSVLIVIKLANFAFLASILVKNAVAWFLFEIMREPVEMIKSAAKPETRRFGYFQLHVNPNKMKLFAAPFVNRMQVERALPVFHILRTNFNNKRNDVKNEFA